MQNEREVICIIMLVDVAYNYNRNIAKPTIAHDSYLVCDRMLKILYTVCFYVGLDRYWQSYRQNTGLFYFSLAKRKTKNISKIYVAF